jgi:ABC-type arginine transport system permease subunit
MTVRLLCAFSTVVRVAVVALMVGVVLGVVVAAQFAPVPGS